jgi:hypothetical protein
MVEFASDNDDYKYILTVIDAATKFGWAYACKERSANEIYLHLESLFYDCHVPKQMGSEMEVNLEIINWHLCVLNLE